MKTELFDKKKYIENVFNFNFMNTLIIMLFFGILGTFLNIRTTSKYPTINFEPFYNGLLIACMVISVIIFFINEKILIKKLNKGGYRISYKDFTNINIMNFALTIYYAFMIFAILVTGINVIILYPYVFITSVIAAIISGFVIIIGLWLTTWKRRLYNKEILYKIEEKKVIVKDNNKLY